MNQRQRKKYLKSKGLYVNPRDTWDLDTKISEFVLPRLELFKKLNNGYPGHGDMDTPEKWDDALDKMIHAFELCLSKFDDVELYNASIDYKKYYEQRNKEVQEGLQLFAKWYEALWW